MSGYSVMDAEIPTDDPIAPGDGMLTCESCGISYEHTGRGRKPKKCPDCRATGATATPRGTSRRATSKDVETAIAVLDSSYSAVALGLMILSPRAASTWAGQIDQLQATNRTVLAGDPNLTKAICRGGERSGKVMFTLAHILAAAPVVGVLREDFTESRKRRVKNPPTPRTPESTQEINGESSPDLSFFG